MANNLKGLDANQVLRSVYDDTKNTLMVSIVDGSTGGGGGFEVIISHINDSIRLGDGTNYLTTTNAFAKVALDVAVANEVDIEDLDSSKDNVAIRDSNGDELNINPDGSLTVQPALATNFESIRQFNEVTAVVAGIETLIVSHVATVGKRTFINRIAGSGDNAAKFIVRLNGTQIDVKRTGIGAEYNVEFNFDGLLNAGLEISPADVISINAIHNRPGVSDFNGDIQLVEVT